MRYPIAAGLGIALWFTGCSGAPKRLSGPGYLASQKAVDAINRAYEYRDEGEVRYDPRFLDAQRAVSEIPSLDDASPEELFKTETTTCLLLLKGYRLQLESKARGGTKAEAAMADYEMNQSYYETTKCVRSLPGELSRLASAGE
jgi:hypothetical protein